MAAKAAVKLGEPVSTDTPEIAQLRADYKRAEEACENNALVAAVLKQGSDDAKKALNTALGASTLASNALPVGYKYAQPYYTDLEKRSKAHIMSVAAYYNTLCGINTYGINTYDSISGDTALERGVCKTCARTLAATVRDGG